MTTRMLAAVSLLLAQSTAAASAIAGESDVAAVVYYSSGTQRRLPMAIEMVRRLVHLCETQFQQADATAPQATAAATVQQARRRGKILEIRYRRPVTFTIAYDERRVHVTHLQVPLSGAPADPGETSFLYLGTPGPPYLRRGGRAEIVALLRELELPVE